MPKGHCNNTRMNLCKSYVSLFELCCADPSAWIATVTYFNYRRRKKKRASLPILNTIRYGRGLNWNHKSTPYRLYRELIGGFLAIFLSVEARNSFTTKRSHPKVTFIRIQFHSFSPLHFVCRRPPPPSLFLLHFSYWLSSPTSHRSLSVLLLATVWYVVHTRNFIAIP